MLAYLKTNGMILQLAHINNGNTAVSCIFYKLATIKRRFVVIFNGPDIY